jgi:predicted RNase H-like HicB family nuclease
LIISVVSAVVIWHVLETLTKYARDTYYSECIDFWKKFKEQEELGNLEQLLDFNPLQAKLVESNGKEAFIPESAYQALHQVIQLVASGQEVSVIPQRCEMTSHEVDDVLNISSRSIITKYIEAAMHRAIYDVLEDDGTFYGRIPECQGVLANAETREACRDELQEVLEEWILLGLQLGHSLPVLDDIDLSFKKEAA